MAGQFWQGKMIKADISINVENPQKMYKALKPDISKIERFDVQVIPRQKQKTLNLKVRAKDISSMRAALNSYLRLINLMEDVN